MKPKSIHSKKAIYFLKHALKEFPKFIKAIYLFSNSTKESSWVFRWRYMIVKKYYTEVSVGKQKKLNLWYWMT